MLSWAVIADDLTGAADTGIQFRALASPLYLVDARSGPDLRFDPPPAGVALFTGTRGLPAGEAAATLHRVAHGLQSAGCRRVYKKIDSSLRGPIGAEIEAVVEVLGAEASFIAPAFPAQGRTTREGIHRLDGRPVAETEMARDPVFPVTESLLPAWIARSSRRPVAHVGFRALEAGEEAAAVEIRRLLEKGAVHVCFDALEERHLELIASLALRRFPRVLPCGSAGLAAALVRGAGPAVPASPAAPLRPPAGGTGILWVCGSASERLREQADRIGASGGVHAETLAPEILGGPQKSASAGAALARAADALARGDLLLRLPPPGEGGRAADPAVLVEGLSRFVAQLMAQAAPRGLFLSGGDTAAAVLERLDAHAVCLEREVASGIVAGRILGGPYAGLLVVTKAGSFGPPEALVELRQRLG
ncbi:MAG: four-carbon acid sugar kinase family protein [Desulfobacterales bacterium]